MTVGETSLFLKYVSHSSRRCETVIPLSASMSLKRGILIWSSLNLTYVVLPLSRRLWSIKSAVRLAFCLRTSRIPNKSCPPPIQSGGEPAACGIADGGALGSSSPAFPMPCGGVAKIMLEPPLVSSILDTSWLCCTARSNSGLRLIRLLLSCSTPSSGPAASLSISSVVASTRELRTLRAASSRRASFRISSRESPAFSAPCSISSPIRVWRR